VLLLAGMRNGIEHGKDSRAEDRQHAGQSTGKPFPGEQSAHHYDINLSFA